uniref:Uncharacterized protein n=1 Tax=Globisporangium ultimum (strain ATCC 200006 / CBS 805.95 / DAOM BR144) TaxID=431595 RepID=K3WTN8_GLOUD
MGTNNRGPASKHPANKLEDRLDRAGYAATGTGAKTISKTSASATAAAAADNMPKSNKEGDSDFVMLKNTPSEHACSHNAPDMSGKSNLKMPNKLPMPKILGPVVRAPALGASRGPGGFGQSQGYGRPSFAPSQSGGSNFSKPAPNMDKEDLYNLKDSLYKESMSGMSYSSYGLASSVGVEKNDGADQDCATGGDQNAFYNHFFDISRFTGTGKKSMVGNPSFADPRASSIAFMPLPRESVAVMIDAVKTSTLGDDEKCRFLFEMFDIDNRGVLTKEGVRAFLEATFVANNVQFLGNFDFEGVVDKLFARSKHPDKMTYNEFRMYFGGVVVPEDEFKSDAAKSGLGASRVGGGRSAPQKPRSLPSKFMKYCRKYDTQIGCLIFYFLLMIAVFILKAMRFGVDPAVGWCPRIAKGCAQIIMVNTLCVLLPMCRNFVTSLRSLPVVTRFVPVDEHIEFHKICGVVMIIASLAHTVAWIMIVYYARTVPLEVWAESKYYRLSFVRDENLFEFSERIPIWTGLLMVIFMAIAAPLAHPKIRRGNFNAFWLTHLLFLPFIILIAIHGLAQWVAPPEAYLWVAPPIVIYFIEKRYRMGNVFGGRTIIQNAQLSKEACALFIKKPTNFGKGQKFQPGMYMFINIPMISQFEWHPFTISSAPEDPYLSLHIRKAGDWTGALYNIVKKIQEKSPANSNFDMEGHGGAIMSPYPTIIIDGPVGAPAQDYSRYREVVFVGAGIGVTPFASILRSIFYQWDSFRCPSCSHMRFPPTFQIRKIYFYWITREQEALTWFTETMNQLSEMDTENRLEIHNYFSSIKDKNVVEPLQALQKFIHNTEGHDIVSGLTTKQMTHFGRPDWKGEFARIADNHERLERVTPIGEKEEIGVFFCGPKPLGNTLHEECTNFNQDKNRRVKDVAFDFHSENF